MDSIIDNSLSFFFGAIIVLVFWIFFKPKCIVMKNYSKQQDKS